MISKEIFGQIILDFQKEELPEVIERDLQVDLKMPIKRAIAILGPRRSGKTYYFYSLIKKLLTEGINKERILYINFEDPKLVSLELSDLSSLLEVFYEIYPQNKRKKVWFFFDEIQNVKNWEIFVRSVLDKEKSYVFLSGSSSKLLSKEIATAMRGRTLSYLILPFSFNEFLKVRGVSLGKYYSSEEKAKTLNLFREYFRFGGYPETLIYPKEREKIVNEIIEVTIHQDLIERHRIRNIKLIKLMFNYLVSAKEFSLHKFYNFLKSLNIKVSKNTLYNYLEFFQEAFIFFPLRKFSWSIKNVEQSIPKIYCVDNAFIESIVGDDKSKKFENLVFIALLQKGWQPGKDLFYSSFKGKEVDFLIKKGREILMLIQACYDISHYRTKEREIESLIKTAKEIGGSRLLIITWDYAGEEKFSKQKIKFIPLWQFLLDLGSKP